MNDFEIEGYNLAAAFAMGLRCSRLIAAEPPLRAADAIPLLRKIAFGNATTYEREAAIESEDLNARELMANAVDRQIENERKLAMRLLQAMES